MLQTISRMIYSGSHALAYGVVYAYERPAVTPFSGLLFSIAGREVRAR